MYLAWTFRHFSLSLRGRCWDQPRALSSSDSSDVWEEGILLTEIPDVTLVATSVKFVFFLSDVISSSDNCFNDVLLYIYMQIAVYNIRLIAASSTVRCKTYDSKFALAPNHSFRFHQRFSLHKIDFHTWPRNRVAYVYWMFVDFSTLFIIVCHVSQIYPGICYVHVSWTKKSLPRRAIRFDIDP